MALIECPECKKQISSDAGSCPNCGKPMKTDIIQAQPPELIKPSAPSPIQPASLVLPGYEVAWGNLVVGLILTIFFAYGSFIWIPSHNPEPYQFSELGKKLLDKNFGDVTKTLIELGIDPNKWIFKSEYYHPILFSSYTLFAFGILITLSGLFYKNYKVLFCKQCGSQVIARLNLFGLNFKCERCNKILDRRYGAYILYGIFIFLLSILVLLASFFITSSVASSKTSKNKPVTSTPISTNIDIPKPINIPRPIQTQSPVPVVLINNTFNVPSKSHQSFGFELYHDAEIEGTINLLNGKEVYFRILSNSQFESLQASFSKGIKLNNWLKITSSQPFRCKLSRGRYWFVTINYTWGLLVAKEFRVYLKATAK